MTQSRLLLLEKDSSRAERLARTLSAANLDVFAAAHVESAREALGLRQFDIVLISLREGMAAAIELEPALRRLASPVLLIIYGDGEPGTGTVVIPATIGEADLPAEIAKASERAANDRQSAASQLPSFDLAGFEQQMGDDRELMKEIIGIFFEESAEQIRDLRKALGAGEHVRASRLAHSLKGSLGSLHAPRARYWADALESAAGAGDFESSYRYLSALEDGISALRPELQEVMKG